MECLKVISPEVQQYISTMPDKNSYTLLIEKVREPGMLSQILNPDAYKEFLTQLFLLRDNHYNPIAKSFLKPEHIAQAMVTLKKIPGIDINKSLISNLLILNSNLKETLSLTQRQQEPLSSFKGVLTESAKWLGSLTQDFNSQNYLSLDFLEFFNKQFKLSLLTAKPSELITLTEALGSKDLEQIFLLYLVTLDSKEHNLQLIQRESLKILQNLDTDIQTKFVKKFCQLLKIANSKHPDLIKAMQKHAIELVNFLDPQVQRKFIDQLIYRILSPPELNFTMEPIEWLKVLTPDNKKYFIEQYSQRLSSIISSEIKEQLSNLVSNETLAIQTSKINKEALEVGAGLPEGALATSRNLELTRSTIPRRADSPLIAAINDPESVKSITTAINIDVDLPTLYKAIEQGNVEGADLLFKQLVDKGISLADPSLNKIIEGKTSTLLDIVLESPQDTIKMTETLLSYPTGRSLLTKQDLNGFTPLENVRRRGNIALVAVLEDAYIEIVKEQLVKYFQEQLEDKKTLTSTDTKAMRNKVEEILSPLFLNANKKDIIQIAGPMVRKGVEIAGRKLDWQQKLRRIIDIINMYLPTAYSPPQAHKIKNILKDKAVIASLRTLKNHQFKVAPKKISTTTVPSKQSLDSLKNKEL